MDAGAFQLEINGRRWAIELGNLKRQGRGCALKIGSVKKNEGQSYFFTPSLQALDLNIPHLKRLEITVPGSAPTATLPEFKSDYPKVSQQRACARSRCGRIKLKQRFEACRAAPIAHRRHQSPNPTNSSNFNALVVSAMPCFI